MRSWSRAERSRRHTIGFVPTMGYLHQGHLRLVDRARELADRVVVSIFVNPLQFGPHEDLARYPRDLPRDRKLAEAREVDCLFVPDAAAMYPADPLVRVLPAPVADTLEGMARPGHFTGVLPEYCALIDENLQPVTRVTAHTIGVVAARVGKTRLLDNVVLGEGIGADPRVTP